MFARQNRDTDIRYKHMDFSFSVCKKRGWDELGLTYVHYHV